jgi:hypothetical protein
MLTAGGLSAAAPVCETLNVHPAIVSVPEREVVLVLAATE